LIFPGCPSYVNRLSTGSRCGYERRRRAVKPSVMIIECRDKLGDPGSEGRFIKHMLDLMGVASDLQPVRSHARFLELLSSLEANSKVVHIATHGRTQKIRKGEPDKFIGFWTPDEQAVTMEDIAAVGIDLSGKVVISTACLSGQKVPREAFKNATRCKHYIAPIRGPDFYNAALMCHIFYHKHFVLNKSVKKAFLEYRDRYKNPHNFCFL
jgi:hypothetical protein